MSNDFTETGWCPDLPSDTSSEWNLREAVLGDGYRQRSLMGLNNLKKTFNVKFSGTRSLLNEIERYLNSVGAGLFIYYDRGALKNYYVTCDGWSVTWSSLSDNQPYGTLSASFKLAYSAGAPAP